MSNVQLSEGGFQVVYPLGLWSRCSRVVKVQVTIWLVNYLDLHLLYSVCSMPFNLAGTFLVLRNSHNVIVSTGGMSATRLSLRQRVRP